jgi:hypothetical protein
MVSATSETSMPEPSVDRPQGPAGQKRRRRGGRRRGRRPAGPFSNSGEQPMSSTEGANPVAPPTLDDGSSELSPDSEIGDFDSNEE